VKAMVVGPMNPDPQPITLLVTIDHGKFTDRHRATEQDGCATESYEKVETPRWIARTRPVQELGNARCVLFWRVPPTPELSARIGGQRDFRPTLFE